VSARKTRAILIFATVILAILLCGYVFERTSHSSHEPIYRGKPLGETIRYPNPFRKTREIERAVPRDQLESYIEHVLNSRDSKWYAALHARLPAVIQQRLPSPKKPSELYPGAILLLSELKPPTQRQAQLLTRYLKHDSEFVRVFAVQGLLEILASESASRSWPIMRGKTLTALTQFPNANTNQLAQCQAVNALMLLNADLQPVSLTIDQLIHRRNPFDDFQQNVGLLAAWRLTPDAAHFSNVCLRLMLPTLDRTRSTMAVLIGQLGSDGAPFRELLEQNTLDSNYSVRKTATNALRSITVSK
jgi:hypothetical protein